MALDLHALDDDVRAFLVERHLATLTVVRPDGTPHVTPVGFSYDAEARLARVITFASARKVAHIGVGAHGALAQIDGPRWLTLEGEATVTDEPARVAAAVAGYATRYRQPGERPDRVAIELDVRKIIGRG